MYRNFKTYRHFLNAKLHALSIVICGDDTVIDAELENLGKKSVTELTEKEAKQIYKELTEVAKKTAANIDKVKEITGYRKSTYLQHKAIIKIARHNLKWSDEGICSYILDTFPDLRERLIPYEIQNAKVYRFLKACDVKMCDKLIKRLIQIEKKKHNENSN